MILQPPIVGALRKAGLRVNEISGWRDRGHGPFTSIKTIACHHTAGPKTGNMPSLGVITHGRAGLPGPLCNFGLGRDGTVYVVAAGIGYHAGVVASSDFDNRHAIGIEAEATGVTGWPELQMDAYGRLCAALCDFYQVPTGRVLGHKEIATPRGRKIDPNFDMTAFRRRVEHIRAGDTGTHPAPRPVQEDDMPLTNADVTKILNAPIVNANIDGTERVSSLAALVTNTEKDIDWLRQAVKNIAAKVGADLPKTPVRIFTANIKHTMRKSRVASDIRHAVHLGGIGLWQEIETKHSKSVLAGAAAKAGLDVHCIGTECPITINPARWVVETDRVHFMHKGRFLITPHRGTSEVRMHRRHGDHVKVCVLATHMVSSAWSTRAMSTRKWRRAMWYIHYRKLQSLIRRAHGDGYTVVLGLDANKGVRSMRFHRDQRIVSAHGIDGIIVVPATGVRSTHSRERIIRGLFTDHAPVTVDVALKPRPRAR